MDFDEMKSAHARAIAMGGVTTRATGEHMKTFVVDTPTQTSVALTHTHQLIDLLNEQHEVRYDPLCREAALALRYEAQQVQINLSQLEGAIQILKDLYVSVNELGENSRNWPWEVRGNGVDQKLNSALDACEGFIKAYEPWTS